MAERVRTSLAGNQALDRMAQAHLPGLLEPEDVADTAIFLASYGSRRITGRMLPVDSGVTIS